MKALLPLLTANCLVLAGVAAASAREAGFDRNVISCMEWRDIGPKRDGVITRDMNGPENHATVFAPQPSHHAANSLWTGSDDGLVHIARDHGAT